MKKWALFFLFLTTALVGVEQKKTCWSLSLKASHFYPQDKTYRNIYKGGFLPLAEVSVSLPKNFFLSLEEGYFHKKEHITSFDVTSTTSITQMPFSLFVGYVVSVQSFCDFYLKAGPHWMFTKTRQHIPNLAVEEHKNTFGVGVGSGCKFYICKGFFAELFLNYLYNRRKIENSDDHFFVYLGGYQMGGGLGYRF